MYEQYTRQALPSKKYRELLGSAICVFNTNNAFIIENILRVSSEMSWYELIDEKSGQLKKRVEKAITQKTGSDEIEKVFDEIVDMRNRIIHSFQITSENGEQILATKEKVKNGNKQFHITEGYLLKFIELNEKLCMLLYDFRGKIEMENL